MIEANETEQLNQKVEVLKQVEVFSGTPAEILLQIAKVLTEDHCRREEVVFRQGDAGNAMYIIVKGSVRVHVGDHVLTRLGRGKVFGEYALFDKANRSASITSEDETLLYKLERNDFAKLVESDVRVMQGVLKLVLKRIREMNELEKKLAQSYLKIQKQNNEIEHQNRNISLQKKELEQKNSELMQLNEEKSHLINVLAHDLRDPLTSSLCLADLFHSQPDHLSKDQIKSIEVIEKSLRKINRIINQIVDINEIETKNIALKPEKTNLSAILHEIGETYKFALAQKNITLVLDTTDLYALVDPKYVSLILENLLSNAIKFSPSHKKILMKLYKNDTRARIEIVDQGPGISEQDIPKLFGKYQKQMNDTVGGKGEHPLGLSIVMKYVDAMNGKVWCLSEKGKGSTIVVEFENY